MPPKPSHKKTDLFLEFLYFIGSITFLGLILFVLYGSIQYWTINFPYNEPLMHQLFYSGVGIAIISTCAEWVQGRINTIITVINKWYKKEGV